MKSEYLNQYLDSLLDIEKFYIALRNAKSLPTDLNNHGFYTESIMNHPIMKSYLEKIKDPNFNGLDPNSIRDIVHQADYSPIENLEGHLKITKHPRYGLTTYHNHSFIELVYVYKGECPQIINEKEIILHAGDICLMSTNTKHQINPTGNNDLILNVLIPLASPIFNFLEAQKRGSFIYQFFINVLYQKNDYNQYFIFSTKNKSEFVMPIEQMVKEYTKAPKNIAVAEAYLTALLLKLIDLEQNSSYSSENKPSRSIDPIQIFNFMHKNMQNASLSLVSNHFHYNPKYLSLVIKKISGKTFSQILSNLRINEAANLLSSTDLSVQDIANQVGYKNMRFFYQIFTKHYNETPAVYRKNNQSE